jgi:TRAP transporter TAXI family solute receptor
MAQGAKRASSYLLVLLIAVGLVIMGYTKVQAQETQLTEKASIATHPVGSFFNVFGIALAGVITRHSPIKALVKATGGTSAWLPLMDSREVDLGVIGGDDLYDAYRGTGMFESTRKGKGFNVCLHQMGAYSGGQSFIVRDDSDIKTIADLKGKRVGWGFPSHTAMLVYTKGILDMWGISENDIKKVMFNDIFEGVRGVGEGKADATIIAAGAPVVTEINAVKPLRFLDVAPRIDSEMNKKLQAFTVGSSLHLNKANTSPGLTKDTILTRGQIALAVRKDFSEKASYEIAKALWEHCAELAPSHPLLRTWKQENMVNATLKVPYHPGAIRLYKEKGAWTPEMEKSQQEFLKAPR